MAVGGALLFERIALVLGTKNTILVSLVIWTGIVIYAYGFLQTIAQAWLMGAVLAMVLGGSQALSRSLYSQMIPSGHEAAFFGVYEITERGTSWIGPLLFGLTSWVNPSGASASRPAAGRHGRHGVRSHGRGCRAASCNQRLMACSTSTA